jgi:hypothetical protein
MFVFAHEQHMQGGLGALRQKVRQETLPMDVEEAVRRDVSTPAQAQLILDILETAISLLSSIGGSFVQQLDDAVGDMTLGRYLKTVLLMDEDLGSRAITTQVPVPLVLCYLRSRVSRCILSIWKVFGICCTSLRRATCSRKCRLGSRRNWTLGV